MKTRQVSLQDFISQSKHDSAISNFEEIKRYFQEFASKCVLSTLNILVNFPAIVLRYCKSFDVASFSIRFEIMICGVINLSVISWPRIQFSTSHRNVILPDIRQNRVIVGFKAENFIKVLDMENCFPASILMLRRSVKLLLNFISSP